MPLGTTISSEKGRESSSRLLSLRAEFLEVVLGDGTKHGQHVKAPLVFDRRACTIWYTFSHMSRVRGSLHNTNLGYDGKTRRIHRFVVESVVMSEDHERTIF